MKTMAQVVLENLIDSGVTLYPIGRKAANWEWISCEEAISELEALQPRTCKTCRFVGYRKSDGCSYCSLNNTVYCDPVKEKFCCNRYEPKE